MYDLFLSIYITIFLINLKANKWVKTIIKMIDQNLFLKNHIGVKFLKYNLSIFQISCLIFYLFKKILIIYTNKNVNIIKKKLELTKVLTKKDLEFFILNKYIVFVFYLVLVFLFLKHDHVYKNNNCK